MRDYILFFLMTIRESKFHSHVTGTEIHRVSASPQDDAPERKGIVVVLHGLGDHIGCHIKAMELFSSFGYQSEGFDWPGNGKSGGKRGDIPGVRPAIRLLTEFIENLDEQPVAIYAHSTGGFLCLPFINRYGAQLPLKWLWLSSPLLRPTHNQSKLKICAAELLAEWVPELTISTGVKPSRCYHISDFNPIAVSDEFKHCHSKISARFGRDLILWESEAARVATKLRGPLKILITQGEEDQICPPEFAEELFLSIPSTNKSLILMKGLRHEPFREPENGEFIKAVTAWLKTNS